MHKILCTFAAALYLTGAGLLVAACDQPQRPTPVQYWPCPSDNPPVPMIWMDGKLAGDENENGKPDPGECQFK